MKRPLLFFFLVSCSHAATHTGVEVNATYGVAIDQLLISGWVDDAVAFTPGVLPDEPRPLQPEGESATIYVPVATIGKALIVRVDGLRSGQVVATGSAEVTVIGQRIEKIGVALGAAVVCGDGVVAPLIEACDDGNRQASDGCGADCTVEAGYDCSGAPSVCLPRCGGAPPCSVGSHCVADTCVCDATTCASGCCVGGACMPGNAPETCGSAGQACTTCPAGQACAAGTCSQCASSCNGCCAGATCTAQGTLAACGANGDRCVACDTAVVDGCSAGACSCGGQPACVTGEKCVNGVCNCGTSCDGCCGSKGCEARAAATCGSGGSACQACAVQTSDSCAADGTCACGAAPACGANETCSGGACVCGTQPCAVGLHCGAGDKCVCDTTSCSGCCAGASTCLSLAQENAKQCGTGGQACAQCPHGGKKCVQGVCQ